ncbi:UNVERIFIED_CONTAM: hypothetical protein Sradi_3651500 [Sesamum radiatum]|uniref:Retrotransposon gag domain-containing protein n=1 Tax=Sesamum radiatum TaxID=300843 RepID=A0AAW2QIY5_SESRA
MAWFNQLPIGTIESFEQLSLRFLHHFAINKRYPKTASYLFTVIQREHESLRDYVQRFSEAVLEVPHVNPELLASIMQQNLRRGRFRESIAGKPPATLDELLVRAEKYIWIEETSDYTPLKAPRAEILAVAERQGIVRRPLRMREDPKRMRSSKYCQFYKDHGRSTEDCFHLKDDIEQLIQQGYLEEYIKSDNPPREGSLRPPREGGERGTRRNNQDNLPTAGVIGIISGGSARRR